MDFDHHGQGIARALLDEALAWARAEPTIAYVDLSVFEGNAPAIALYERAGFHETGRVPDRFRIGGVRFTDIQMTAPVG